MFLRGPRFLALRLPLLLIPKLRRTLSQNGLARATKRSKRYDKYSSNIDGNVDRTRSLLYFTTISIRRSWAGDQTLQML